MRSLSSVVDERGRVSCSSVDGRDRESGDEGRSMEGGGGDFGLSIEGRGESGVVGCSSSGDAACFEGVGILTFCFVPSFSFQFSTMTPFSAAS